MKLDETKLDAVIARRARLEQLASGRHKTCSTLQCANTSSNRKLVDKATRLNAIKSDILHECCDHLASPSLNDLVDLYTIDSLSSLKEKSPLVSPPAPPRNPPSVLRMLARQPEEDLLAQWRQQRARGTLHASVQPTITARRVGATTFKDVGVQATSALECAAVQTAPPPSVEAQTSTVSPLCAVGTSTPDTWAQRAAEAGPPWDQGLSDAAMSACAATFAAHVLLHMAGMRSVGRCGRTAADAAVQVEPAITDSIECTTSPQLSSRAIDDALMDGEVSVLMQHAVQGALFPEEPAADHPVLHPVDVVNYLWEQLALVVQEPGMEQLLASCVQSAYAQVARVLPLGIG